MGHNHNCHYSFTISPAACASARDSSSATVPLAHSIGTGKPGIQCRLRLWRSARHCAAANTQQLRLLSMNRHILSVLLLGVVAAPAWAHLDTLAQIVEPDPLVRAFEAEALPARGNAVVVN